MRGPSFVGLLLCPSLVCCSASTISFASIFHASFLKEDKLCYLVREIHLCFLVNMLNTNSDGISFFLGPLSKAWVDTQLLKGAFQKGDMHGK
jgi:hypothetical protein